jgi:hypothetical protein
MPAPRHVTAIVGQPKPATDWRSAAHALAVSGEWTRGVVSRAAGEINAVFTVTLESGTAVVALSVINEPIEVGTFVWVVQAGTRYIVVGVQR